KPRKEPYSLDAYPRVRADMDIEIVEIDLVAVDYHPRDVYAAAAPILADCYLARIEEDGVILAKEQIKIIVPPQTETILKDYEVYGTWLETLVGSAKPFEQGEWHVGGGLPCHLTRANAERLKSLMTTNNWDHYFCLAQT